MYSSEKNPGFNWKDIIIKAVFLVIFLLLLVWLFPKVPNMTPFYSNVFRENIKYMQDAAESYYTTDKLPKNIGDTAEMTLGEMINKNLILPFVDEDGNSCDLNASYVQVTKNKNDYTLKVNLVCPTETNFIEKTLGCYEYCEDCEEELEYQFKKEVTSNKTSYSCPNGGVLSGTTCYIYSSDSYKATETTSTGELYCSKGGTLKNGTCYVADTDSYKASTNVGGYTCPYGGILSGTTCYVDDSYTYNATPKYDCPNGGTLSGTTCYITGKDSSYAASIKNYTCNGKTQSSSTCTTTTADKTYAATPNTGKKYLSGTYTSKPSGYTCSTSTQYVCTSSTNCPGYIKVYNSCYTNKTTYTCPNGGDVSGTTCIIKGTTSSKAATPNYHCPNGGDLNGTTCIVKGKSSTYSATPKYDCPNGGVLSGTTCKVGVPYTYSAVKTKDKKYCPNGGSLSGNYCIVDASYTYTADKTKGETVLTCPNGGELKDKTCYISKVSNSYTAKATTNKVTTYQYQWSTEKTLAGWTATGETRALTK